MTCKDFDNLKIGDILSFPDFRNRRREFKEIIISIDEDYYNLENYRIQRIRCYSTGKKIRADAVFYIIGQYAKGGVLYYDIHKDLKIIRRR